MTPKILRRCGVCKRYHAAYRVVGSEQIIRYLRYDCWHALEGSQAALPPRTDEQAKAGAGEEDTPSHPTLSLTNSLPQMRKTSL